MSQKIILELQMPDDMSRFEFPAGLNQRLQHLLDQQDQGTQLTPEERTEAEGLVSMAEMLSLLRLRAEQAATRSN